MPEPTHRMHAVRYHEYGEPSVLRVEEVDRPDASPGEVLVKVRAAGVVPFDWKVRAGHYREAMPLEFPHVPGAELSGTVVGIGEGVIGLQVGDDVFGAGKAAYAQYAVAPAATLARKPTSVSFEQAASIGMSGVTAMQLVDTADLQAGQRVLIHGGAGGVGSIAVQLAHLSGAYVIATTSAVNVEHVRGLGADEVIDYDAGPFEAVVHEVDVVLDTVGGETKSRSWGVLKPGGLLISIADWMPDVEAAAKHGVRTIGLAPTSETSPILQRLADLVDAGTIRLTVADVFPLDQAAAAHAASETGHGRGRRVLRPAHDDATG